MAFSLHYDTMKKESAAGVLCIGYPTPARKPVSRERWKSASCTSNDIDDSEHFRIVLQRVDPIEDKPIAFALKRLPPLNRVS